MARRRQSSSTISGSNNELVSPRTGSLTLTGNVTAAGIRTAGALAINGTTTITNGDNLNPATGLFVENDATITGTGPWCCKRKRATRSQISSTTARRGQSPNLNRSRASIAARLAVPAAS